MERNLRIKIHSVDIIIIEAMTVMAYCLVVSFFKNCESVKIGDLISFLNKSAENVDIFGCLKDIDVSIRARDNEKRQIELKVGRPIPLEMIFQKAKWLNPMSCFYWK